MINHTYNVNVPRNKSQKNADTNIEYTVCYRAEQAGKLFKLVIFCYNLQAKAVGEKYSFNENIGAM